MKVRHDFDELALADLVGDGHGSPSLIAGRPVFSGRPVGSGFLEYWICIFEDHVPQFHDQVL